MRVWRETGDEGRWWKASIGIAKLTEALTPSANDGVDVGRKNDREGQDARRPIDIPWV